ncbi:MAG: radical SAM protein [Reyranella sp.]|nr:radical SAM protein [Reyranella sp.]MDP3158654.1 radical SAM protein [Reyranella sp.]
MNALRYSKEDFGYLVVFPDGKIDLYTPKAAPYLGTAKSPEELEPFRLKEFSAARDFHLRSPLIVWFEVTRKCNLTCTHCYIDAGKPRKNELSFAEIVTILHDLRALGTHSVVFAGGEPYARKDFPDILQIAAELGFVIAVVTNGSYLTPALLERFPREQARMTLSVDGIDAHHAIRGGRSTFPLMAEKLSLAMTQGVPCSISTVISRANIHELETLLNWCIERDIVFRTVTFNPLGRGLKNLDTHMLRKEDAAASASLFMMQKRFEGEKDKEIGACVSKFFNYAMSLMYMTKREHCSRSIAYIAADGEVFPCVSSAATGTFAAGNVRERPFSKLWSESFQEMRSILWEHFGVCNTCPYSGKEYFCANRCPVMSLILNGELTGCGASEFEKEDLRLRTDRLRSEMGNVY